MTIRSVISCVSLAAVLTVPLLAQQQTEEERRRAANMARELERLVNQLQAARVDAQGQGGGGRGGRSGGAAQVPPGGSLFQGAGSFDPTSNDPMSGPVVANAPFSADAVTTVTQVLGDGTRIDQRANAKFYRDGTGRIRREQTIVGMDWANPQSQQAMTVITFDSEPGDPRPYQLDPNAKTARRVARTAAASPGLRISMSVSTDNRTVRTDGAGGVGMVPSIASIDMPVNFQGLTIPRRGIPADLRPADEQLGSRTFEGIKATGKRTSVTIPTDRVGNDRPIQITDERWESPELGLVVYSRFSDPRTGIVEYRLTNVNRSEPAATLFQVPSDYSEIGGQRTGGGGGRGRGAAPR